MSIFSKIFNAFRSMRLNDQNPVVGQKLDALLLSSMYAEQQSAYLNSYVTGLDKSTLKTLLQEYWQIYNKGEAVETLLDLQDRNADPYLDVVYQACENNGDYVEILKSNLPSDPGFLDFHVEIHRNLRNVIPELIEQNVIKGLGDVLKIKDAAWNYGRGAFLARCCFEMGYLSEVELQEYLENSLAGIKKYCTTWKEYTVSYILGRALSGGASNSGMIQIAEDLLNNPKSPLKNKTYL